MKIGAATKLCYKVMEESSLGGGGGGPLVLYFKFQPSGSEITGS